MLDQSLAPLEIIVVNDGSSDATEDALQPFLDRIIYCPLAQNSGPSAARNAGIARASGDYLLFQDADDYWHPRKLELIRKVLAEKPVDFLFHPYALELPETVPANPVLKRYSFLKLLLSNPVGTPCVAIRRHARLHFNPRLRYAEDVDLWLREAYRSGVYALPVVLTQIGRPIRAAGGQSGAKWQMRVGEMKAFMRLPKLNILFLLLVPFLVLFSLAKHILKVRAKPRGRL